MKDSFKDIDEYIEFFSDSEPEILQNLGKETYLKTTHPHMLSGHFQGRFLSFLSKVLRPKKILEIGTFTGYATICLSEGLDEFGEIVTIDHNDELEIFHEKYIDKSPKANQIKRITGDALEQIQKLDSCFDLVFLDADKERYLEYYKAIMPKINSGGVLLVDNVLWYEKVLSETKKNDLPTKAIKELNKMVKDDDAVNVVVLPIRDGLSMIRKI